MDRKHRKIDWLDVIGDAVIIAGIIELIGVAFFIKAISG